MNRVLIRVMEGLLPILILALGVGFAWALFGETPVLDYGWLRITREQAAAPPWPLRIIRALPTLAFAYALYRLWRLFRAFRRGTFFSQNAIGHLRAFAAAYAISVIARLGVGYLVFSATHDHAADGAINHVIEGVQFWELVIAAVFYVVASALNEARKDAEQLEDFF